MFIEWLGGCITINFHNRKQTRKVNNENQESFIGDEIIKWFWFLYMTPLVHTEITAVVK